MAKEIFCCIGTDVDAEPSWGFIELAQRGPCGLSMMQAQDVLALGSQARMNAPGIEGGWSWQMAPGALTTEHAACPGDTSARTIARDLVDGRSQLLVFGLGPHGTPAPSSVAVSRRCSFSIERCDGDIVPRYRVGPSAGSTSSVSVSSPRWSG